MWVTLKTEVYVYKQVLLWASFQLIMDIIMSITQLSLNMLTNVICSTNVYTHLGVSTTFIHALDRYMVYIINHGPLTNYYPETLTTVAENLALNIQMRK